MGGRVSSPPEAMTGQRSACAVARVVRFTAAAWHRARPLVLVACAGRISARVACVCSALIISGYGSRERYGYLIVATAYCYDSILISKKGTGRSKTAPQTLSLS